MNTLLKLKSVIPLFIKKFYWNSRRGIKEYIKTNFIDQAIPCDVRKLTFKIGVSNDLEYFRIHTYEKKEPELLDWLDSSLRKQDTLYDIGANIGLYSLYAAKLVPEAQVYSFEPEANNYTRLCRNIL